MKKYKLTTLVYRTMRSNAKKESIEICDGFMKIKEELCSGHSSSGDVMRIQAAGVSAAGVSAATG